MMSRVRNKWVFALWSIIVFPMCIMGESTSLSIDSNKTDTSTTINQNVHKTKIIFSEGVLFGSFTKDDGPFLISGNVIIPYDQILEFGPACTVYVGGNYSTITVFGRLRAIGTKKEPVVFMSAKVKSEKWDWDRIYCRSRDRSIFKHCIIKNSNYGIVVENGSAAIHHCIFENNSLSAIAVKHADVTLSNSKIRKAHSTGLLMLSGATVDAESLYVDGNISGIYSKDSSNLRLSGGYISNNINGIIASENSNIAIVGAEITHNKTGIVSEVAIPDRMKEMVYSNTNNIKVISKEKMEKIVKEPLPVQSIVFPSSNIEIFGKREFQKGFSALMAPKEPEASFIGNVSIGFTYYDPESRYHPIEKDSSENYTVINDSTIDTTRTIKKVLHHQTKYPGEQSEKWYSGIQPEFQFFANGRRGNTDINILMDLYGNQWLSTSNYVGKNMANITLNYTDHQLVFGDFFESGSETSITGRQLTGIRYTGKKIDMGRGEKRFIFKLAAGETEIAKDSGDHEIFIYNETVDTGMSKRQQITYITEAQFKPVRNATIGAKGIIAHDQYNKPLFRNIIGDPAAFDPIIAQTGCFTGNVFLFDNMLELFGEIDLGVADTLTDSEAQNISWYNPKVEEAFPKILSLFFKKDDFVDHSAGSIGARGEWKKYNGNIRYLQVSPSYFSAGDPYLTTWRKNLNTMVNRIINEKFQVGSTYEFDRTTVEGIDDESNPVVTDLNIGTVNVTYEMGNELPKLSLKILLQHQKNDAREYIERSDTMYSVAFKEKEMSSVVSFEGRQNFKNGMAYSLRYQMLYDNDYGVHPDSSKNHEGDRFHNVLTARYSMKVNRLLRNRLNVRFGSKHENRDSLRAYMVKVSDKFTLYIIPRRLNCSIKGEYAYKTEKEYHDDAWTEPFLTTFYSGEIEVKYSITSRLSGTLMGRYEKAYDDLIGSNENYTARIAGLHVTYLF